MRLAISMGILIAVNIMLAAFGWQRDCLVCFLSAIGLNALIGLVVWVYRRGVVRGRIDRDILIYSWQRPAEKDKGV